MELSKLSIKNLLAANRTDEAIDRLFTVVQRMRTESAQEADVIYNQLILLAGQFTGMVQDLQLGLITSSDAQLIKNRTRQALIVITDRLPETFFAPANTEVIKNQVETGSFLDNREIIKQFFEKRQFEYDVFLSFSSIDIETVRPVCEELRGYGLKVFFSDESFKSKVSSDFFDLIEAALENSKNFLLVCTPNAMKSEWVKLEYKTFFQQFTLKDRKNRLFIILKGTDFDMSLLPLMLRNNQIAGSVKEIIESLVDSKEVEKILNERILNERIEKEKQEKAEEELRIKNEKVRIEKEELRIKNEKVRIEAERLEKEKAETFKRLQDLEASKKAEKEQEELRIKNEKVRIEAERLEKEKAETFKRLQDLEASKKAEKEQEELRIKNEKVRIEAERLEKEKAETFKRLQDLEASKKAEKEQEEVRIKNEKVRIEAERLEKEKAETFKRLQDLEASKKAEKEQEEVRIKNEKVRIEKEQPEKEPEEKTRLEREKLAKEHQELKIKNEKIRLEREKAETFKRLQDLEASVSSRINEQKKQEQTTTKTEKSNRKILYIGSASVLLLIILLYFAFRPDGNTTDQQTELEKHRTDSIKLKHYNDSVKQAQAKEQKIDTNKGVTKIPISKIDDINTKMNQFNNLINNGLFEEKQGEAAYTKALTMFQKAKALNVNNATAQQHIDRMTQKINTTFKKYKEAGQNYMLDLKWREAITNFETAQQFGIQDAEIDKWLKQCKNKLK